MAVRRPAVAATLGVPEAEGTPSPGEKLALQERELRRGTSEAGSAWLVPVLQSVLGSLEGCQIRTSLLLPRTEVADVHKRIVPQHVDVQKKYWLD